MDLRPLGYDPKDPTHVLLYITNRANLTAGTFSYWDMVCLNRPELNTYVSGAPFDQGIYNTPENFLLEIVSAAFIQFNAPTTARTDSYFGIGMSANASGSTSNSVSNFAAFTDDFRMVNLDPNSQSDMFNNVIEPSYFPEQVVATWEGALPTAGATGSRLVVPHLRPDLAQVQRVKACISVGTGAWDGQKAVYALGILKAVV